jgi:hypothetical protein
MNRMRSRKSAWAKAVERSFAVLTRSAIQSGAHALGQALKPIRARRTPPPGEGSWLPGVAMGAAGARRFRLYRPPDVAFGERLPLLVMLYGCGPAGPCAWSGGAASKPFSDGRGPDASRMAWAFVARQLRAAA